MILSATEEQVLLTARESQCLQELAQGERPQRIAAKLGIAQITVEFHIKNARRKLGARTREHAIAIAVSSGMLVPPFADTAKCHLKSAV